MPNATALFPSFLGGEISLYAQGRYDRPDYRTSMRVCLNSFPAEIGCWNRRPGSQYAGHTRGGAAGRVIDFDFEQAAPVTIEFTDGHARFRAGTSIIPTNDPNPVVAISTANPAVVQTANAGSWSTGDEVYFFYVPPTLLQNRQFVITVIDSTHFSLADALTGVGIDGSTLGAVVGTVYAARIQDLATPYTGGSWASIRTVQAETTSILLSPTVPPQALTVTTLPAPTVNAAFAISPATFNDGPYLDPFTNGVQAVPGSLTGIVTLALSFPAYVSTTAYAKGTFVTSSNVNYKSLVDQNVGNTPASSPSQWAATSAGAAINNGKGFLGTDLGRLVRLFSEPPLWLIGTTYANGNIVAYNPSGVPGESTYYQAVGSSTGVAPGSTLDGTNWSLIASGAAVWTWGKIVSLTNIISPSLSGSTSIGNMVQGGGVNAVFNGTLSQPGASSAALSTSASGGFYLPGATFGLSCDVGKDYAGASDQAIEHAVVYPSSDFGFAAGNAHNADGNIALQFVSVTFNLFGSATNPTSMTGGTLLGSATTTDGNVAVSIVSSDQVTQWAYVWVEQVTTMQLGGGLPATSYTVTNYISQLSFYSPTGTGDGAGCEVEILGPALLYSAPVVTWQLGVYSNTTGFPTCGAWHDGRLWLGGAIANRFDASMSNGIAGSAVAFSPTDQYGEVAANHAISETLNSDSSNQIIWMKPDLQGILMGTQAGEFLVFAPTGGSIAPANISAHQVTKIGSANIEPRRTEHTLIFVRRYARKLMEYFADIFSGKFSAPNLADKAEHIPRTGVEELAYTEALTPILWGRNTDGSWFGITYKRDSLASSQPPTFYGWARHALGSGRTVESICSGPSVGGNLDSLTMVTNDPATNIRHVEVLTDAADENTLLANCWFLDDAVTPVSVVDTGAGLTINGLWHLNGKVVQVFAAGLDCGDPGEGNPFADFTVVNGSVTVPYGDGISAGPGRGLFTAAFVASISAAQIVVGFTYNSDGQLIRPVAQADTGARSGPALGDISRVHRFTAKLVNTMGISFGSDFGDTLRPALFTTPDKTAYTPLQTFTGVWFDQLEDDYSHDRSICWRVSRPLPATITAIATNVATQDQ